jgi:phage terminase large subunit
MTVATIELPPKLIPVFTGSARYRGAYGGRGSAKTRSFAKMTAVRGLMWAEANEPGVIIGGREFMNSLDDSSMAEIKAAIESEPFLRDAYDVGETYIRTKCRRIEYKFIGLRHSLDSIKSKARVKLLWVDEAEPVSETAWAKAVPSVREHDSEIWVTWNPERKTSATHKRFRVNAPEGAKIVEMNWRDNPWFPDVLNDERLEDLSKRPDSYDHVWEGDFKTVTEGAYFTREIAAMKSEGRLGRVAADPLMSLRAFWDIGGTGAKADACAIWVAQFVGREIRVLNYYEAKGQPLSAHVEWLRSSGYGNALCVLPHDGAANDKVFDVSYESALQAAEFETVVVPNQGKGAASKRIEAARRLFPSVWMNKDATEGGLEALAAYHELIDEKREIGLGPCHDWSSHGADAFGLMCVAYEEPRPNRKNESIRPRPFGAV